VPLSNVGCIFTAIQGRILVAHALMPRSPVGQFTYEDLGEDTGGRVSKVCLHCTGRGRGKGTDLCLPPLPRPEYYGSRFVPHHQSWSSRAT